MMNEESANIVRRNLRYGFPKYSQLEHRITSQVDGNTLWEMMS